MKRSKELGKHETPMEQRAVFMLARSVEDLTRTRTDFAGLLSVLIQRGAPSIAEAMLGICIDAQAMANVPCELEINEFPKGGRTVRIVEATGVSGIWMLCFLDAPAGTVSRSDLLDALLNNFGREQEGFPLLRFVPVFPYGASAVDEGAEVQLLKARHSALLLPSLYLDPGADAFYLRPDCGPRPLAQG